VVRVVEHGDARASGELAGDLDGVLDGFGAGVEQHGLLREVTGRVLGEQFRDANVRLVRGDREHAVGQQRELLAGRLDDGIIGVPDRHDPDARAEVDELVAVDVDDDRTVGALEEDGQGG